MDFESKRLRFQRLTTADLDAFHRLVEDEHVRRYLMDGEKKPRDWSADRVRDSDELFGKHGIGLWMVDEKETGEEVGFCGFLVFPALRPEPQLLYAMYERF